MDQQQAKLILSSFRPDGSDAKDPAFTEALELAARDSALGSWLAEERAHDLAFAHALADLPIPENLREDIFEVLTTSDRIPAFEDGDLDFGQALSSIKPPANLREDILSAMQVEQKVTELPAKKKKFRFPAFPSIGLAAAAGIALALVWTNFIKPADPNITVAGAITPAVVQSEAISFISSPNMSLDRKNPRQEELFQFLASNELPTPEILPAGLESASGIGCKMLNFNHKPASLICFQQKEDSPIVHLIVMKRGDVEGALPELATAPENCSQCQRSGWSVASWEDEERAFFLLGKMDPTQLAAVF